MLPDPATSLRVAFPRISRFAFAVFGLFHVPFIAIAIAIFIAIFIDGCSVCNDRFTPVGGSGTFSALSPAPTASAFSRAIRVAGFRIRTGYFRA